VAETQAHAIALGDRGRFVMPVAVRERHGWAAGQALVALDTDAGVLVMSADEALTWLRSRLEGRDLVAELLAERRADVARETA
jgi:bifunctional DNA-binding transcriptional regulator/antitoxin component of YhaV-PrlF toxin-antitoxin module